MFRAKTYLPFLSVVALSTGLILFFGASTNWLTLFAGMLLWFVGCATIIVWSASMIFGEKQRAARPIAMVPRSKSTPLKKAS